MNEKGVIIGSLVIVLIALVLLNNYGSGNSITGYVVRSVDDVFVDVQVAAADNAFKVLGTGAKVCVVIEMDDNNTYYYELVKSDGAFVPEHKYCADAANDAIIIKFNSYDDFADFKSDSLSFLTNKRNTGYYIFPSKYVEEGGAIVCDAEFQERYCGAAYYYWNEQQMRNVQLDCCANYVLPKSIKDQIDLLKKGRIEKPATFINATNVLITIVLLAVLVALVLFLVKKKSRISPEIKEYIKESREAGYTDDQIKEALKDSGWEEKEVNNALGKPL